MAKLIIRKECLESEVYFTHNNSSHKVVLKNATQEELKMVQFVGVDVFEKPEEKKEK